MDYNKLYLTSLRIFRFQWLIKESRTVLTSKKQRKVKDVNGHIKKYNNYFI